MSEDLLGLDWWAEGVCVWILLQSISRQISLDGAQLDRISKSREGSMWEVLVVVVVVVVYQLPHSPGSDSSEY